MIKISVVIPVYNKEKYLESCLISVLNQTYKNIEIICIDDGSTDKSVFILKKYQKIYKNIKLFVIPHSGVSFARNYGILKAEGEYIHFIDADDLIHCDIYTKICNELNDKKNIDLITFITNYFSGMCDNKKCNFSLDYKYFFNDKKIVYSNYYINPEFYLKDRASGSNLGNKLFNSKIIKNHNILFNTKMCFGEDAEFYYRYIYYCNTILSFSYVFYFYRLFNEHGFTSILLNKPGVFENDLLIFKNSINLFKNKEKDNKNVFFFYYVGVLNIIFDAYFFITDYLSRTIANIELSKFIDKYFDYFNYLNLQEFYKSNLSLIEFNKKALISNENYFSLYNSKVQELENIEELIKIKTIEIIEKNKELNFLVQSKSYKIGRFITFPFRLFKKIFIS